MQNQPLTVTEVSQYIKALLDRDEVLSQLCIRGEISNYKMHSSGHHYFTLKDDGAVISCVMFRGDASRLRFRPETGMKVILYGRVSSFPKSGQYQVYVNEMQPDGVGALYVAFEQLKERLLQEGLFRKSLKKPLPAYPHRIAIVTSPTGAAVRDMIRILGQRYPLAEVVVCPVKVQGEGSAQEIADMLDYVNEYRLADVIITGRGGGSIEDLWAFNEEVVARAIFRSEIPVISAVGHEPDITIADYAADVRASTPSNAAELAVCDASELKLRLNDLHSRMAYAAKRSITAKREKLEGLAAKKILSSPYEYLNDRRMLLSLYEQKMTAGLQNIVARKKHAFVGLSSSLDAMSPLKVLSRGYSMVSSEDAIVKSVRKLKSGDQIDVKFSDGAATCTVDQIKLKKSRVK